MPNHSQIGDDLPSDEWFDLCGRKLNNFKDIFIHLSDRRLSSIHTFTVDDIAAAYGEGADKIALANLFDELSLEFGSLSEHDKEHFILDNPLWGEALLSKLARECTFLQL